MKINKIGASLTLGAMLFAGAAGVPAYAQEDGATETYLVTLNDVAVGQGGLSAEAFASAAESVASAMENKGMEVTNKFTSVGVVTAKLTAAQAKLVEGISGVKAVEKDQIASVVETQEDADIAGTQKNAPWHLDRIDQDAWNYNLRNGQYIYRSTGKGITAYIVDTGVDPAWPDIRGRVGSGVDFVGDGNGPKGCHPHGSMVAASAGGTKYGVAKDASFVSLRVLDCTGSGTGASTLGALDWVAKYGKKPSVVNMSLRFPVPVEAVDEAVRRVYNSGRPVVVAAGNDAVNACNITPAREPLAITVAATDKYDYETSFTNYGRCVDLYAPGQEIKVHANYEPVDGTSFSSPMVAGAVAQYLETYPRATPAEVAEAVIATSRKNRVKYPATGTPNRLLNAQGMSNDSYPPKSSGWNMSNAGKRVIGTHSFVWGTLPAGATSAWTEVKLASGWSKSQTRNANANGFVKIPLTYGLTKPGTYTYRVGTTTSKGVQYTPAFNFVRTPLYVSSAGVKKINQVANMWGTVPVAPNRPVSTQVWLGDRWSTSQTRTADARGYVAIPLTYGAGTPGTYKFRAVYYSRYGAIVSQPFTFTRVR